ncbi:ATP-binding cassette domain-containing protein [Actinomadura parmotrematis]|uniref:ATP-binding cassette domain-containing protein n=1 Tax=Actinomadura parmotrematis TaxID=2864039 RepID=A0ABS7G6U5_9ACTN|nr:ATP-binding cassette domain-containing protein [Actinomadura parmotrematis]MBW8487584.1 ATP-binding cassette domain-containing protein [Actinomadura parmotrematis]
MPPAAGPDARGLAVETAGLSLRGPRGWVYRDARLAVPANALAALAGPAGSGRTSLLLTLGGRMRPTEGTATVGDRTLPAQARAVRRLTALGAVAGVNDLEPALTVGEHVGEALALHEGVLGRWRNRRARVRDALDRAGLDADPRTRAGDLAPDEAQLLGAALALIGRPGVLLLDDVDAGLPFDLQERLWERLRAIAASGVTVIASCHDPAPAGDLARIARLPGPHPERTPR